MNYRALIQNRKSFREFTDKQVPFTAGYEHEWLAFAEALRTGKTECDEAPHAMTLKVSEVLTELRRQAQVIFPFE